MRSTTTKRYPLSRTIQEISPSGEIVAQWGSCAECAADIGVHTAQLYKNTRNGWRTKKRIFAFADLPDNQEPVAKRPRPTDPKRTPVVAQLAGNQPPVGRNHHRRTRRGTDDLRIHPTGSRPMSTQSTLTSADVIRSVGMDKLTAAPIMSTYARWRHRMTPQAWARLSRIILTAKANGGRTDDPAAAVKPPKGVR